MSNQNQTKPKAKQHIINDISANKLVDRRCDACLTSEARGQRQRPLSWTPESNNFSGNSFKIIINFKEIYSKTENESLFSVDYNHRYL